MVSGMLVSDDSTGRLILVSAPQGQKARFKSTQLCQTCAKVKNVCQVCVLDLTYGETTSVVVALAWSMRRPTC